MVNTTSKVLAFHPVTQDRWPDMEQLFESRGGPHPCWCMVWRDNNAEYEKNMLTKYVMPA